MNVRIADRAQRSFSRSFQSYHQAAREQADIADALAQRLLDLGAPLTFDYGFEIGCGTGHLTQALLRRFSFSCLTLNDLVPGAGQMAQSVGAGFLQGDAREILWPKAPDLIASASTLQWMNDPKTLVQRAARNLAPGGWLAFSGFGPDQYQELRALGSAAQAPGLCLPDVLQQAIEQITDVSFDLVKVGQDYRQMWFDHPLKVLHHLRQTGVNATASRRWSRADLALFNDRYMDLFGGEHGVSLTSHPIWLIARKARDHANLER